MSFRSFDQPNTDRAGNPWIQYGSIHAVSCAMAETTRQFKERPEDVQSPSRTRQSNSYLEQRLRFLTIKRPTWESSDTKRGPLGLNLLYQPTETQVDFIFCHGLRCGSRKTWSYTDDSSSFWPK